MVKWSILDLPSLRSYANNDVDPTNWSLVPNSMAVETLCSNALLAHCVECGRCCFSERNDYVEVNARDYKRLGHDAKWLVDSTGRQAFMRMVDDHCIALLIAPGKGTFHCNVYRWRPEVCRLYKRGSPECMNEQKLERL